MQKLARLQNIDIPSYAGLYYTTTVPVQQIKPSQCICDRDKLTRCNCFDDQDVQEANAVYVFKEKD